VKTRHVNTNQRGLISRSAGVTSRNTGVAYLRYLFVTSLVLIPTFIMRLYLSNAYKMSTKYVQKHLVLMKVNVGM